MARRVVITGAGVISPLGDSPAQMHAALLEGRRGSAASALFDTQGLVCHQCIEIQAFSPEPYLGEKNFRPLDRTARLLACACQLALDDSGWSTERVGAEEVGLVVGTMFCSLKTISDFDRRALREGPCYASPMDFANTVINAAAGQTAIWHNLRGINCTVSAGATSGLQALAHATELIRTGRAQALLAGGVDELCFESFYGFRTAGLLCGTASDTAEYPIPFDVRRNGFALGEGAALLMLEDADSATARGARVLAEIKGHGSRYDCRRARDDEQATGTIARTMQLALHDAEMTPAELDCVSASANGSVRGDRREAQALKAIFQDCPDRVAVTAIKSMLGEALGGAGALQAAELVQAMHQQTLPGIPHLEQVEDRFLRQTISPLGREMKLRNGLINSVGFDGHCCSLVLTRGLAA
jgi:3-oxoacyl-[acyl-carrier-protein] synthase II